MSNEILAIADAAKPSAEQSELQKSFFTQISKVASLVIPNSVSVPFGSAVNGFWTPTSDLDICVKTTAKRDVRESLNRPTAITALRRIGSEISRIPKFSVSTTRLSAKVPVLKVLKEESTRNFLSADLSINNLLAVENSGLIGSYVQAAPALRPLGLTLKLWAASRGINDRSKGTLSSFAITCMTIHFLQKKFHVPDLQLIAVESGMPARFVEGFDCRWADVNEVPIDAPLAALLTEWFRYFAYEYPGQQITITDRWRFDPRAVENKNFLCVENPFEPGVDVANVTEDARLLQEFRRAYGLCSQGATLRTLCGL